MLLRKYRNQSLHSYVFHYIDIHDALILEIFYQNQLFTESFREMIADFLLVALFVLFHYQQRNRIQ
jgi:hypothetical protein